MEDSDSGAMVKLTATNYTLWRPRMEDLLYSKDLFDPIEEEGMRPNDELEGVWKKKHRKTIGVIRQWIDNSIFHHISEETDAYVLWKKLENMYQAKTARNKALLMRRLINLKLRDGTSVAVHTSEFQQLANQLAAVDLRLGDEEQALLLLSSLPDSWETLVVSLSNSAPDGKLTMAMVKDALFSEEARRKEAGISDQPAVFVTERRYNGRGRSVGKGRSQNHGGNHLGEVICWYCGVEGHMKRNCRKLHAGKGQSSEQSKKEEGTTYVTLSGDIAIISGGEEACLHGISEDAEWVVDTAASYHATPSGDLFTTYKAGDFGTVKMGNSTSSNIVGIGDIEMKTGNGCTVILKDVRHVPDLRLNLMSVTALDRQGYDNHFGKGTWKLTKGTMVVARGQICGTLYKTHVRYCGDRLKVVNDKLSRQLWQKRLGHMGERGLVPWPKKALVPEITTRAHNPYNRCLVGKQKRVWFRSPTNDGVSPTPLQSATDTERSKLGHPIEENTVEGIPGVEQGEQLSCPPANEGSPVIGEESFSAVVEPGLRLARGWVLIPSRRYLESAYVLLTDMGEPLRSSKTLLKQKMVKTRKKFELCLDIVRLGISN